MIDLRFHPLTEWPAKPTLVALEGSDPRALYRQALKKAHPDHGGSRELLEQVQDAGRKLGVA